jgi:hypothetical protein
MIRIEAPLMDYVNRLVTPSAELEDARALKAQTKL